MSIFNYGNGFIPNYNFNYNNGNMSSTTNIVNGVAYTQNVINLGGNNSSCSTGPNYCQEGYSIYVPCLKQITRGQNVCFQFYVADKSNQDVVDLNDLCGLTLQMSGPFGCPYGEYTYPEDIKSLQNDEIIGLTCEDFNGGICKLDIGYIEWNKNTLTEVDKEYINQEGNLTVNITGKYGDFYEGSYPYLKGEDTPTHIFVGWTTSDRIEGICENFKVDDLIVCGNKEMVWDEPLHEDTTIYAVYRKRKTYKVKVSFDNRHSYFIVTYKGKEIMLSDKVRDYVEVEEGYHFIVKCVPITSTNKFSGIIHVYNFYSWKDGNVNQIREYLVEDKLFTDGKFELLSICKEDNNQFNVFNDIIPTEDLFFINLPELNVLENCELPFTPTDNIIDFENITQIYNTDNDINHTYILITDESYLSFKSVSEISDDIKIVIKIDTSNFNDDSKGEILVRNGSQVKRIDLMMEHQTYEFDFENCEEEIFDIKTTINKLYIDNICVYKKLTTNKGKMEICIPSEDTLKFHSGVLNMSGAICVGDDWYGLDSVQIGVVNKLNPINII